MHNFIFRVSYTTLYIVMAILMLTAVTAYENVFAQEDIDGEYITQDNDGDYTSTDDDTSNDSNDTSSGDSSNLGQSGVNSSPGISGNGQAQTGSGQALSGSGQAPSNGRGGLYNPLKFDSLTGFLMSIINVILILAVPVIVFFIIYAGFLFVTAQGNETQLETAKSALLWAIVGAVIVLGAKVILTIVQNTVDAFRI